MTAPTELDERALEAGAKALRGDIWETEPNPNTERYCADLRQQAKDDAERAIRTYLSVSGGWRDSQAAIDVTEALLDAEKALKQIVDAMMPGQARRLAREALIIIGPAVASALPAAPDRRAGE